MTRDELKRYLDRFAYQTRHGTELAADMVLQELWQELVPYCDVCGCTGTGLRTPVEVCRDCYDGGRR